VSYPSFALGGFAYLKEGISNTFPEQVRKKKKKRKDERESRGELSAARTRRRRRHARSLAVASINFPSSFSLLLASFIELSAS